MPLQVEFQERAVITIEFRFEYLVEGTGANVSPSGLIFDDMRPGVRLVRSEESQSTTSVAQRAFVQDEIFACAQFA